jgi:Zn-finger nucleic acid-binding protein
MKPSRWCPHCAQPLEAFLVNSPAGAEVELERCKSCGGFWGQRGRIQDHFGPNAQYQLVGGTTTRHCVECRILMTPAKLPAGIDVEVCPACRGMFLDAEELAQVGVRTPAPRRPGPPRPAGEARAAAPVRSAPPPRPVAQAPKAPEPEEPVLELEEEVEDTPVNAPGTFECVVCHKRKPVREGQALRDGLACRPCMRARLQGGETEDLGLRNLLFGRPKKPNG